MLTVCSRCIVKERLAPIAARRKVCAAVPTCLVYNNTWIVCVQQLGSLEELVSVISTTRHPTIEEVAAIASTDRMLEFKAFSGG